MDFEVVIVAAPKDYEKVRYAVTSIRKYLNPSPKRIHVITPENGKDCFGTLDIEWHNEQDVLPLNPRLSRYRRPLWVYQQFLKLGQNVTSTDDYLIVDSDLILLKPINVFAENGQRQFFMGLDLQHYADYATMQHLWGIGKEYQQSFISEMMLMNKVFVKEIVGDINQLYVKVCNLIDCEGNEYRFSEYQLYGNYVYKMHPYAYALRDFRVKMFASFAYWTPEQIADIIREGNALDMEAITYHSWVIND